MNMHGMVRASGGESLLECKDFAEKQILTRISIDKKLWSLQTEPNTVFGWCGVGCSWLQQQPSSSQQQAAIRTAAKCDHNRYLFLRGHNYCLEPGGAFY